MQLLERLTDELKDALRARDHIKVSVIRLLKSTVKNREIEKKGPLTEDELIDVIMSAMKQRRESIEQFHRGGREDLVKKESSEIEVLQEFLPPQLTQEELEGEIKSAIREVNATSSRDMGKVMKALMARVKGKAEGTRVSSMVKEMIESQVH